MHILTLLEAPLPDDWDSAIFSEDVPFETRVEYAKERAIEIGVGSSRIAFAIMYEGRNTVLKVAKNSQGMSQNEAEVNMIKKAKSLGAEKVVIPLIDYDTTSTKPTWLHVEYAEPIYMSEWRHYTDTVDLNNFIYYLDGLLTGDWREVHTDAVDDKIEENDWYITTLIKFVTESGISVEDLQNESNWGWYNNIPVITDLGLTPGIWEEHYSW